MKRSSAPECHRCVTAVSPLSQVSPSIVVSLSRYHRNVVGAGHCGVRSRDPNGSPRRPQSAVTFRPPETLLDVSQKAQSSTLMPTKPPLLAAVLECCPLAVRSSGAQSRLTGRRFGTARLLRDLPSTERRCSPGMDHRIYQNWPVTAPWTGWLAAGSFSPAPTNSGDPVTPPTAVSSRVERS